jgi:hypothetical protein
VIRQILKSAGYNWRKARTVLTSNDKFYKEKVARVREVASQLSEDEVLFSIDEFGPFHVRQIGGRTIVAPGKTPVVQQRQKSRGRIILTAAIELSSNQVTHFYSERKNSAEMIKMLRTLRKQYRHKKKIWISWDSASWHQSTEIDDFIYKNNDGKWPKMENLLLPAAWLEVSISVLPAACSVAAVVNMIANDTRLENAIPT